MRVFLAQMESADPRGPLANWSAVSEIIQMAMREALSGQKTPEQAMRDAAASLKLMLPGKSIRARSGGFTAYSPPHPILHPA
jgi:maltose-binding protein MalE